MVNDRLMVDNGVSISKIVTQMCFEREVNYFIEYYVSKLASVRH